MAETYSVPGNLSRDALAATLSVEEQKMNELLTDLKANPKSKDNLATFTDYEQPDQLGLLSIPKSGAAPTGTKVLSAVTAYIDGKQTQIDVYRMT
jgi:hypothetical protein